MMCGDFSQPLGTTTNRSMAGCRDNKVADIGSTAHVTHRAGSATQRAHQGQGEYAVAQGTQSSNQYPRLIIGMAHVLASLTQRRIDPRHAVCPA